MRSPQSKKERTFRVIEQLYCDGAEVSYTDHNNKYRICLAATFIRWVDKTRQEM